MNFQPVCRLGAILKSLKNCFFVNVTLNEEKKSISSVQNNKNIDSNKQKIFLYLKAYKPILDFIKDSKIFSMKSTSKLYTFVWFLFARHASLERYHGRHEPTKLKERNGLLDLQRHLWIVSLFLLGKPWKLASIIRWNLCIIAILAYWRWSN